MTPKKPTKPKKPTSAEGHCRRRDDEQHCDCWWDGAKCCACNAPAMTRAQKHAQGMEIE